MRKSLINQRIREVAAKWKGSKAALARTIGVTPQKMNQWLSGAVKPTLEMLPKIVSVTGVSYDWLLTGKGEMHGAKLPANINVVLPRGGARCGGESDAPTGRDAAEYRELWRAADALAVACPAAANAGEPIIPEEHLDRDSEKYYLFRRRFLENINRTGNFICIVVDLKEGRSMHPTLAPGDLLLVDRNLATYMQSQRALMKLNGSIVLLANPDDRGLFVKRIWIDSRGRLIAQSDNPEFAARIFELEGRKVDEIIVGRVVWRGHEL